MPKWKQEIKGELKDMATGNVFRLVEGPNSIRILPNAKGDDLAPYAKIYQHKNVGPKKRIVRCGKSAKDKSGDCYLCDVIIPEYEKSGKRAKKALAASMSPTPQYVVQVAVMDDESGKFRGPFVWYMPTGKARSMAAQILGMLSSNARNYEHPDTGFNLNIRRTGTGLSTTYSPIEPDSEPSRVPNKVLDNLKPFGDVIRPYSQQWQEDSLTGRQSTAENAPELDDLDDPDDDRDEPKSRRKKDDDDDRDEPKSRRRKDEDEEEEERPRHSRDRDEDEERPRRKKDEDEDEERPRRSRDRDEDEERPRRSRDRDDEDERRSRRDDVIDEEEKPKSRRRKDEDEEEERPRKSRDEEEERPRKSRDEEEDRPRRSRDRDDGDDYGKDREEERPRRSRDDDPPSRRKKDEDDEPPRRSRDRDEEEERPRRSRDEDEDRPRRTRDRDEDEDRPRRSRRED